MKGMLIPHDAKIQGREYQQVIALESGTEKNNYRAIELNEFFVGEPDLKFDLFPGALLTDVIKTGQVKGRGFLLSDRLKQVLVDYNIIGGRFYKATVFMNRIPHDYWFFHLVSEFKHFVDYPKVDYEIYDPVKKTILEKINFDSFDSLKRHWLNHSFMHYLPVKYFFTSNPPLKLDVFLIGLVDQQFYMSDRLAETLLGLNITGVKFIDLSSRFGD